LQSAACHEVDIVNPPFSARLRAKFSLAENGAFAAAIRALLDHDGIVL
jgi:hypothetical protein